MFICKHKKSYILIIDNSFLVAWSRLSHIYIWSNPMILLIYTFLVEWTRHSTICISRDCFMRLIITLARTSTTTTGSVQLELINKHVRYSLFPFLLFFLSVLMNSYCISRRRKKRIYIKRKGTTKKIWDSIR
jgi:hypothetical protein